MQLYQKCMLHSFKSISNKRKVIAHCRIPKFIDKTVHNFAWMLHRSLTCTSIYFHHSQSKLSMTIKFSNNPGAEKLFAVHPHDGFTLASRTIFASSNSTRPIAYDGNSSYHVILKGLLATLSQGSFPLALTTIRFEPEPHRLGSSPIPN